MQELKFVLASASPRRHELLALVVPQFEVCPPDVDEGAITAGTPAQLAQAIAQVKCLAAAQGKESAAVIGCDTVVEVDGVALGKPRDAENAFEMLRLLSARSHFVHTGVCVAHGGRHTAFTATSEVFFAEMSDDEINAYIATGEVFDKAGAYGVQGGAAKFVRRIEGCYFNVMGLPVSALYAHLRGENLL